ncbi:hypothetical protein NGRA_0006 [Nosema granulosis]|uniref:Uncharacterized protein n=1 Tax=Nosema granulosis TaxID=83296 RepID=A0A9P6H2T0_9MICR|nr:hypothetical protein NGRA_0006 [Nosema granulosis]
MGNENESTKNKKNKKLKREESGDLSVPGGYFGPWAGYSGLPSDRSKKEKLRKFTVVVNKNCLEENKEITRSFGTAVLRKNEMYSTVQFGNSYKEIAVYNDHRREVTNLKILSAYDGFISSSLDGKVHLYSLGEYNGLLKTFLLHSKGISYLDTHRSDSLLCTGSYDKTFKISNLTTSGRFLYKYNLDGEALCGASNNKDNFFLGGPNGNISVIDIRDRNTIDRITASTNDSSDPLKSILDDGVNNILVVDDNYLAYTLFSGSFGVVDIRNTKEPVVNLNKVERICNYNSSCILFSDSKSIYKFNYKDNSTTRISFENENITSNIISKDSKVFFAIEGGNIKYIDIEKENETLLVNASSTITCINISNKAKSYLVVGDISGSVKLLDSQ